MLKYADQKKKSVQEWIDYDDDEYIDVRYDDEDEQYNYAEYDESQGYDDYYDKYL